MLRWNWKIDVLALCLIFGLPVAGLVCSVIAVVIWQEWWGIPAGLLLLGFLIYVLRRRAQRQRREKQNSQTTGNCENCRTGSGGAAAIFLIFALIVLAIVRSLWFAKADGHYDKVISAYIAETEDYEDEDKDELRRRLLEDGMFIKIFRWDKKSFVKDEQLYDEMIKASKEQQRKKEAEVGGFVEDLINL